MVSILNYTESFFSQYVNYLNLLILELLWQYFGSKWTEFVDQLMRVKPVQCNMNDYIPHLRLYLIKISNKKLKVVEVYYTNHIYEKEK